ncbi:MAG: ATP-binding protein [Phycisphaerales bacterium]
MAQGERRPTDPGALVRGLIIVALALLVAGGSMLLGLTAAGWASPLIVVGVSAALVWYLLERGARQRRVEIGRIGRRVARIGVPLIDPIEKGPSASLPAITEALDQRDEAIKLALSAMDERHGASRAVIDAIHEPVIATDADGRVVICNASAATIFGRPAGEAIGAPLEDLVAHRELLELHERARREGPVRQRLRLPLDSGPQWFDVSLATFGESGNVGVAITLLDVTELATAVQLKTDFAANASHELRTPIASIRAAIETLSGVDEADPAMRKRLHAMIEANVTRLEEMVSDLLDLSKLESPDLATRRETIDLEKLGAELSETYAGRCAQRDLRLVFEIDPSVRRVECDPNLLELILRNLIDNAAKFAFEGTKIRVAATPLAPGTGADGVRIRVIDKGEGIPLKHQQRIFERFYQVDEARSGGVKRRGTGLGLAIVKHAARRLGGSISVESVWQQGTTMIVDLPGAVARGAEPPQDPSGDADEGSRADAEHAARP